MEKKGQPQELGALILWICGVIIVIVLVGVAMQVAWSALIMPSCPVCEKCEYSSYEQNITECQVLVQNISTQLTERPVITNFINNTEYVHEYRDLPQVTLIVSYITIPISIGLIIFLSVKIHLFKIEIKLPTEIETELKKLTRAIMFAKIVVYIVLAILVINLILVILST